MPEEDLSRPRVRITHEPDAGSVAPYELELLQTPGITVTREVVDPGGTSVLEGAERLAGIAEAPR